MGRESWVGVGWVWLSRGIVGSLRLLLGRRLEHLEPVWH